MSRITDIAKQMKSWWNEDDDPYVHRALDEIIRIDQEQLSSTDIVKCIDCRRCSERGGHANCNGYLYCRKWKTSVDESCFCSWGERK